MEKKLVLAIEKLTAIEEFARDLREYLESSLDVSKDVSAPSPTKVEEKPVKEVVKAVEEPVQEDDLQSVIDEYGLNELSIAEIKEFLNSATSPVEYNKKVKKAETLVPILAKAIIDGLIPLDDDEEAEEEVAEEDDEEEEVPAEEDEEDLTVADIEKMTLKELLELASENELEVPAAALKNVNKLREALIELIEADDEADDEEDFEASAERLEAEAEVEAQIRQQLKGKKLNAAKMKKFLADYQEGNPDCEDCGNCSTEELTDCYIQTKQALVDDEGEVHEASDLYLRNGINHCCGAPLQEDGTCAICGSEWE